MEIDRKEAIVIVIVAVVLVFCIGSVVSVDPETLLAVSNNPSVEASQQSEEVDISGLVDIHDDAIFSALIENERQALKSGDKIANALRASFDKKFEGKSASNVLQHEGSMGQRLKESFKKPTIKPVPVIKNKQSDRRFVLVLKKETVVRPVAVVRTSLKCQNQNENVHRNTADYSSIWKTDWPNSIVAIVFRDNLVEKGRNALEWYGSIIDTWSAQYNLPKEVIAAVIAVESGGNPRAVGRTNDYGAMQLQENTAIFCGVDLKKIYDPHENIRGGSYYIRYLMDRYNDYPNGLLLAFTAYNRGPGRVDDILSSGKNPLNGYAEKVLCIASMLNNSPSYAQR